MTSKYLTHLFSTGLRNRFARDHPTSATPKATPVDLRAPSHALTEPLTDIPVGPLENSLEGAMLNIQTTWLAAYGIADRLRRTR